MTHLNCASVATRKILPTGVIHPKNSSSLRQWRRIWHTGSMHHSVTTQAMKQSGRQSRQTTNWRHQWPLDVFCVAINWNRQHSQNILMQFQHWATLWS